MSKRKPLTESVMRHAAIRAGMVKMQTELTKLNIPLRDVKLYEIIAVTTEIIIKDQA